MVISAWKADKFYRPPKDNMSLFKCALGRIDEVLRNSHLKCGHTHHTPNSHCFLITIKDLLNQLCFVLVGPP